MAMRTVEDWEAAYKMHKEAKRTGGPCEVCGWKDGDGVKVCFYSPELGAVTHQNTDAGAMATMTPAQRSLFGLGHALLYIDADLRERAIQRVAWDNTQRRQRWEEDNPETPFRKDPKGRAVSDAEFMAKYRAEQEDQPLATSEPYAGWIHTPWWIPADDTPQDLLGRTATGKDGRLYLSYMVHCHEPHPDCGGVKVHLGPYHFGCSRCGVEVRLWEHGIDYDIG